MLPITKKYSYEPIVYFVIIVIHLIPLFTGTFFPTSDGAAHLYNAELMKDMLLNKTPILTEFLEWNLYPDPNRFSHVYLATLLFFLPDFAAEKVVLASYLIFFPLGFRYLIKSINHQAIFLSVFSFPLMYNLSFWFGFYNFCFSMIFFFYFAGYWIRKRYQFTAKQMAVLIFFSICMYSAHPVAYVFSIVFVGLWIISDAFRTKVEAEPILEMHAASIIPWRLPAVNWPFLFKQVGVSILIYGITGGLLVYYVLHTGASTYYYPSNLLEQFFGLAQLIPLQFLAKDEIIMLVLLYQVLFCLLVVSVWRFRRVNHKHYLIVFGMVAGLGIYYIFGPDGAAGGSAMHPRIGLLFYICVIILASFHEWRLLTRRLVYVVIVLISLGLMAMRVKELQRIQSVFSEIMTAQNYIAPQSVTLPYCFYPIDAELERNFPLEYHPLKHYSNYLLLGKSAISLDNYEARTGYFPLNWKLQKINDPVQFNHLNDMMSEKEQVRSIAFHEKMIGQPVDYMTLVGTQSVVDKEMHTDVLAELDTDFELIYESEHKIIHVYRRKKQISLK